MKDLESVLITLSLFVITNCDKSVQNFDYKIVGNHQLLGKNKKFQHGSAGILSELHQKYMHVKYNP